MRKTTQILTTTGLFIIGLTVAAVLVDRCDPIKPQPPEVQHPNPAKVYGELQQIDNSNSEHEGKWRGLCRKGSVNSIEDFRQVVNNDPILKGHFANLNYTTLKIKKTDRPTRAVVYHRSGAVLAPTSKPISIPAGDPFITDGVVKVRMQCCNNYEELEPPFATPPVPPELAIPPEFATPGPPPVETIPPLVYVGTPNMISGHHNAATATAPAPVPEPSTILMFGAGLASSHFLDERNNLPTCW